MYRSLVVLLTVLTLAGCGKDASAPDYDAKAIDDLAVTIISPHGVSLSWTAPGIDGAQAAGYEVRYRVGSFAEGGWDGATVVSGEPLPGVPGGSETFAIHNLPAGDVLVFRVGFTYDGWLSDPSNAASAEMPDAAPIPDGFAYVPGGVYTLGSPTDERGRDSDETRHAVTLSRAFFVGLHEVTNAEYAAVTGDDPSAFPGGDLPVEQIDWFDAVSYCNARSLADGLTPAYDVSGTTVDWNRDADGYRLPTEAEWEIACRAGTETAFYIGGITAIGCTDDPALSAVGVYCQTDVAGDDTATGDPDGPDGPAAVGGLLPNAWGLYDMHGNVYEWCWDWYAVRVQGSLVDPAGPGTGTTRVIRGGGWTSPVEACRSAARSWTVPTASNSALGFRVVRTAD